MTEVNVKELDFADVVELFSDGYGTATVRNTTEDEVILDRPYIHTSDFICTGGVITYIGLEEVRLSKLDTRKVTLVRRGNVEK